MWLGHEECFEIRCDSMETRLRTTAKARNCPKNHSIQMVFALEVLVLLVNSRFLFYRILKNLFDPIFTIVSFMSDDYVP